MKICISTIIALMLLSCVSGQNPVVWNYSAMKLADKTYEVRITATIQKGWHLYSQTQPEEAIAVPTTIKFTKHPLIKINGKLKEIGKLEKDKIPELGIEQWQYSNKVEFVQTIILKTNGDPSTTLRTNISGNIEYQVCRDGKCLPPSVVEFSVNLTP